MANTKNFIAKNGYSTGDGYDMPTVRPSLLLDFANSKSLDPRITFTRGTTATYWDGHTTTKAEENLVPSQGFSSAWTQAAVTTSAITSPTAPDGTTTAFRLQSTGGANTGIYVTASTVGNPSAGSTISLYAQAGSGGGNRLGLSASSAPLTNAAVFNLSTGAVDGSSGCTATMTAVGNGWYRCVVANIATALDYFLFTVKDTNSAVWSTGSDTASGANIYIWGAQAENRTSVTAYTATSGTPIVKYQPTLQTAASGEARFDHDPVTSESKGLLIEEARTNLFIKSQKFDSSTWVKSDFTVTSNSGVAPDGTLTADGAVPNATNAWFADELSLTQGTTITQSMFAKKAGHRYLQFAPSTGFGSEYVNFDLENGVVAGSSISGGAIEDVGNGWYRCSLTDTVIATGVGRILLTSSSGNTARLSSTGINDFDGVLLWGAQFETGSFPTSYIATDGSTVTRSTDSCNFLDLSQIPYNQGNGTTMLIEAQTPDNANLRGLMNFSGGSETNFYGICETDGTITGRIRANSTYDVTNTTVTGLSAGEYATTAMSVHFNNPQSAQTATNGTVSTADTSFSQTVPANITRLAIGTIASSSYGMSGCVKKAALYPKAFDSATLQAMTEE